MSESDIAISVQDLYKVFRLGASEESSDSFAKALGSMVKSPLSNYKKYRSLYRFDDLDFENPDNPDNDPNVLWALRGVSFDVERGEVLGIIGHNGAGKSTLLKILSRISPPSRGSVRINGRVSSLLEVGTGFHPDLTGRENIYLNGTILGMRKREVDQKFSEIVEFSGVEKFLDTPVKRYSSGMRVRLAFAVAAHLEPEILIIDEVLAVGDAAFQRKCLNKMEDVSQQGRTVLFVSHNMPSVLRLCPRALLLKNGRIIEDGTSHDVVSAYFNAGESATTVHRKWSEAEGFPGDHAVKLLSVRICDEAGNATESFPLTAKVGVEMTYQVTEAGTKLLPHFLINNDEGELLFATLDTEASWHDKPREEGIYRSVAWIPSNLLTDGTFYVSVAIVTSAPFCKRLYERQVVRFQAIDEGEGKGARGAWGGRIPGVVRPYLEWQTELTS